MIPSFNPITRTFEYNGVLYENLSEEIELDEILTSLVRFQHGNISLNDAYRLIKEYQKEKQ